jgi:hypothetical protein
MLQCSEDRGSHGVPCLAAPLALRRWKQLGIYQLFTDLLKLPEKALEIGKDRMPQNQVGFTSTAGSAPSPVFELLRGF